MDGSSGGNPKRGKDAGLTNSFDTRGNAGCNVAILVAFRDPERESRRKQSRGLCLRHSERRLSALTFCASADRRAIAPRADRARDVRYRATFRTRFAAILAHMRRLHLCASCFFCAPPCCKSRVTLARTDPLLTLPAAEAAANWPGICEHQDAYRVP